MQNKITIAIDGYSSTGKSTVAKQLAKELGYIYVDTGAMYRAVALYAMRNSLIHKDEIDKEALINDLDSIHLKFIFDEQLGFGAMYLNNENVEKDIRKMEVSSNVSKIASISEVRKKLVDQQQRMGKEKGIVMDGRDIGTVVFPAAELKLFMTASANTRAQRRFDELKERGDQVDFNEVLKNVEERDHLDTTREDSPLIMAEGAVKIDNSNMSLEEQFQKVLDLSQQAIAQANK